MTLAEVLAYCSAIVVASLIPGPSMALAFAHGARMGAWAATVTALGNAAASLLQAAISFALTVAALQSLDAIFIAVQVCGALYLIYLGTQLFKAELGLSAAESEDKLSKGRRFADGFLVAFLNPKAILFFAALFPQFAGREAASFSGAAVLFAPIAVGAPLCFMAYAIGGERIRGWLGGTRIGGVLNRILGVFFIGLAVVALVGLVWDLWS